jgi:hypothetical protein
VQDAVRQLDSAPFVQLVYSGRAKVLETHHVPRTATGPSEVSLPSPRLDMSMCICISCIYSNYVAPVL